MNTPTSLTRSAAAAVTALLLVIAAGCSKPPEQTTGAGGMAATGQQASGASDRSTSRLGDLTPFRTIATDVSGIVLKGELPAAKARIKYLEIAWDSAEASLKPRAAVDWHQLDKAIDRSLGALRADPPNPAYCKATMSELLDTIDRLQSKP